MNKLTLHRVNGQVFRVLSSQGEHGFDGDLVQVDGVHKMPMSDF